MRIDVWLYGELAPYAHAGATPTHGHCQVDLPDGATMRALLTHLAIPLEKKGITFINAVLADMPGLGADLDHVLRDSDRVGIFAATHMWPFQYRFGARMLPELEAALRAHPGGSMAHSYSTKA
jgi:hypothetical protein